MESRIGGGKYRSVDTATNLGNGVLRGQPSTMSCTYETIAAGRKMSSAMVSKTPRVKRMMAELEVW